MDKPWESEPDRQEWRHRGLPCLIVRAEGLKSLCGYVGVPEQHKDDPVLKGGLDDLAHGGITFEGACRGKVCHVPLPGEHEVHWFGFDCAHSGDLAPGVLEMSGVDRAYLGTYKSIGYVEVVCNQMADFVADHLGSKNIP